MRRTLPILLTAAVAFAGCRAKEAFDKADIAHELNKSGSTRDLMKDVASDHYTPPSDGHLTDAQVQMYLKVRDHERDIAQVAKKQAQEHADAAKKAGEKSITGMMEGFKTLASAADMATADIRAAKDLHYNTQEYLWVKGQIMAASLSAVSEKVTEATGAQMDAAYTQMKKAYDEAKDEQTKKMYADMLAGYDKSKNEMAQSKAKEEPAVAYNRQLLSKYENALKAYTNEMSKWEDKPGEAQKSMDDFQKGLDKSVEEAKKAKQ
ncbi:MAG TPA: hypothetical protein VF381_09405 [Thermoanaerobaculia bacterium]